MMCEIKGRITADLGVKTGTTRQGTDYEIREYLITEQTQFGKSMAFTMFSNDGPIKEPLRVGDDVTVYFNVSAKEYTDKDGKKKWFNSVQALLNRYRRSKHISAVQAYFLFLLPFVLFFLETWLFDEWGWTDCVKWNK